MSVDFAAHRTVSVLRNQRAAKGIKTRTRCTTCGFTTEDETERSEHYPRHLYAAALIDAAAKVRPKCRCAGCTLCRADLLALADEATP